MTFVKKILRGIWRELPISGHSKNKIKILLFTRFPFFFSWSGTYREWQYINNRLKEEAQRNVVTGPVKYIPLLKANPPENLPVRLIAFYLPQFHAIPENNAWWGDGFTEWTNVSAAKPLFDGHYQPHVPGELGYYNLLDKKTQHRQIELAKLYGISGFCFYYYWFAGKKLLEQPLENYLTDPSLDHPFCLCWANENWSRQWDGLDSEILISQQHSPEDDLAMAKDLLRYLSDSRYIRVNNKPLLIVYRPNILPSAMETCARWRDFFRQQGIGEIFIAYTQSFDLVAPAQYGFDAAIEFPPNKSVPPVLTQHIKNYTGDFFGNIFDWSVFPERSKNYVPPDYRLFRSVCPAWDNTARRKNKSTVFINNTPESYQHWLEDAVSETCRQFTEPSERLVFVNAWNEWAEGAHLEPDQKYGYAWLEASRKALTRESGDDYTYVKEDESDLINSSRKNASAMIIHLYYFDIFEELSEMLQPIANEIDFYFSVRLENLSVEKSIIKKIFPNAIVVAYENRGRDILPFLKIYNFISKLSYETICKIHSKKSLHREDGDKWRQESFNSLIGSKEIINRHINKLCTVNASEQRVGIIGSKGHILSGKFYWAKNKDTAISLAKKFDCPNKFFTDFYFVAGTMFWFHADALKPLLSINITDEKFEDEGGQLDGTIAHAIERVIGLSCKKAGLSIEDTDGGENENPDYKFSDKT